MLRNTKKLIIALVCSLTLNLFAIGLLVGFWVSRPNDLPAMHHSFKFPPHEMSLQMREAMKPKHKQLRENRRAMRLIKQEIKKELKQKDINITSIEQALLKLNDLRAASATLSQEATVSAISKMSYEERVALSNKLFKRPPPERPKR